jgi:hypothetical protein
VHWFIGLKHVGQLGVLLWFSMENYDNGVISSEFWCVGFTTGLGVEFLSLLFLSVIGMFRSSRLQHKLFKCWSVLASFWSNPKLSFVMAFPSLSLFLKVLHSHVLGITQSFKWKFLYDWVGSVSLRALSSQYFEYLLPLVSVG